MFIVTLKLSITDHHSPGPESDAIECSKYITTFTQACVGGRLFNSIQRREIRCEDSAMMVESNHLVYTVDDLESL